MSPAVPCEKTNPALAVAQSNTDRILEALKREAPEIMTRQCGSSDDHDYIECSGSNGGIVVSAPRTLPLTESQITAAVKKVRDSCSDERGYEATVTLCEALNKNTCAYWLATNAGGPWYATSVATGQEIRVERSKRNSALFDLSIIEGTNSVTYADLGESELIRLADAACRTRASMFASETHRLAGELRAAGFSVLVNASFTAMTVRSAATNRTITLRHANGLGWSVEGDKDNKFITTSQASTRVRLELTKPVEQASQEHERFEEAAREATQSYLKKAGMRVVLTAKERALTMIAALEKEGVVARLELIDDHAAVCVTDPSTRRIHKAICDPAGNWLMEGESVYALVAETELKELAMRQGKKARRMDMDKVKEMAVNAAYLTAANKVTESMQAVIVAGLMRQLGTEDEAVRVKIAAFFSSELGASLIAGGTGFALQVLPHEEDGRIERLAESLQTSGMAKAMGAAIDVILQPMLGSVQEAIKGLPETPKVRATLDAPVEEQEEPAPHSSRRGRAQR